VTVVVATREPPSAVAKRVANILDNSYPLEKLAIVVAVDHTAEYLLDEYRRVIATGVTVVSGDAPGGKACALNAAVRAANTDFIVFTDTAPMFRSGAIAELVSFLDARPDHGGVTGVLELATAGGASDAVLERFWRFELQLREAQAARHSVCAVTGCIYAIRRSRWRDLPAGAICDDLFVPMQIIADGFRVGVASEALAYDARVFTREQEFRRKVRTLTGMLQFVSLRRWSLLPWRNAVWLQFVCHKLLRIATPFLLLLAAGAAVAFAALTGAIAWLLAAAAAAGLLVAIAAALRPAIVVRVARAVGWALLLLCAPFVAVWNAIRGRWNVWPRHVVPT
jgi:cellulose synthase/poly-beta-1,6-N-acetylglucosamine synthase-like glycosyltransferase